MKSLLCIIFLLFVLAAGCTPEPVETDLLVPVKFSAMPSGLAKTGLDTHSIEVRVKGSLRQIHRVEALNLTYLVDLYADLTTDPADVGAFISPSFYAIPVIKDRLAIPPGVVITQITPAFITVQLDRKETCSVPVEVVLAGQPALGYEVAQAQADPDVVSLTGPESVLKNIIVLQTKPVDITGADTDLKKTGVVALDDPAISMPDTLVTVTVSIRKKIITHTYPAVPVTIRNAPPGVEITPPDIEITLKGPENVFQNNSDLPGFQVYIDLKDLTTGVYVRPAVISVPVGLVLVEAKPENFTVKIK